jgi:hypothetical protein
MGLRQRMAATGVWRTQFGTQEQHWHDDVARVETLRVYKKTEVEYTCGELEGPGVCCLRERLV